MVYVGLYYVPAFWGAFSRNWYSDRGFSSGTKEPKLHKLGVFWANYCKRHPIWSKLGAFLSKMVYWWVGNQAKTWYRESQVFEVRQAHPRTILVKVTPPFSNLKLKFWSLIYDECKYKRGYSFRIKLLFELWFGLFYLLLHFEKLVLKDHDQELS